MTQPELQLKMAGVVRDVITHNLDVLRGDCDLEKVVEYVARNAVCAMTADLEEYAASERAAADALWKQRVDALMNKYKESGR